MITREEELALIVRAQGGDVEARNELIVEHLDFIERMVAKGCDRSTDPEAFLSVGVESFISKIASFSPDSGARLTTYAALGIPGDVKREVGRQRGVIDVPHSAWRADSTKAAASSAKSPVWIDAPIGGDEDHQFDLEDSGLVDQTRTIGDAEQIRRLRDCIEELDPKSALIMSGLMQGRTMDDIGEELGVTASRVSQLAGPLYEAVEKKMLSRYKPLIPPKTVRRAPVAGPLDANGLTQYQRQKRSNHVWRIIREHLYAGVSSQSAIERAVRARYPEITNWAISRIRTQVEETPGFDTLPPMQRETTHGGA